MICLHITGNTVLDTKLKYSLLTNALTVSRESELNSLTRVLFKWSPWQYLFLNVLVLMSVVWLLKTYSWRKGSGFRLNGLRVCLWLSVNFWNIILYNISLKFIILTNYCSGLGNNLCILWWNYNGQSFDWSVWTFKLQRNVFLHPSEFILVTRDFKVSSDHFEDDKHVRIFRIIFRVFLFKYIPGWLKWFRFWSYS